MYTRHLGACTHAHARRSRCAHSVSARRGTRRASQRLRGRSPSPRNAGGAPHRCWRAASGAGDEPHRSTARPPARCGAPRTSRRTARACAHGRDSKGALTKLRESRARRLRVSGAQLQVRAVARCLDARCGGARREGSRRCSAHASCDRRVPPSHFGPSAEVLRAAPHGAALAHWAPHERTLRAPASASSAERSGRERPRARACQRRCSVCALLMTTACAHVAEGLRRAGRLTHAHQQLPGEAPSAALPRAAGTGSALGWRQRL